MNCCLPRSLPALIGILCLYTSLSADVFVSDFENGTAENDLGTNWFFFTDQAEGGISVINNSSNNTDIFDGSYGPGYSSTYAGVMDFDIYYDEHPYPFVGMGFNFNSTNTAVDMTGATAVTFTIRANKEMAIKMHFKQSSIADGNFYGRIIDVGTGWTTVTIPISIGSGGLAQESWGDAAPFEIDKLVGLEWLFRHQGDNPERDQDGILYIDNVAFLGDPIGLSGTPADSLQLGDFENGSAATDIGTYWFFFDDSSSGGASTIDNEGPYGEFVGEYSPGCNSDYAGQMDFTIVYDEIDYPHAGMGMYLTNNKAPVDLSGVSAIRFDIRASYAMDIKFHVTQSTVLDYNFHYSMVDAGTSWRTVTVPLNAGYLDQESWGDQVAFDITHLTGFQWVFRHHEDNEGSPLSGTLFIDNVRLIGTPTGLRPPYPPEPINPEWHATGVPTSPIMNWFKIDEATSYSLQISENENMSSPVVDESGIADTFFNVSGLAASTIYYWRINATDGTTTSGWAPPTIFTTTSGPPSTPTLSTPSNEATGVTTTPELSWEAATHADSYALQLSVDGDFSNLTVDETALTSTSYTSSTLDYNTTYHWRVSATNTSGTSNWSTSFSFRTQEEPPAVPVPTLPANDAEDVAVDVSLLWNTAERAETYTVQVATSSAFSSIIVNQSGITGTVYSSLSLENGTDYFWRVRSGNSGGNSAWSATMSFTTEFIPPPAPVLLLPAAAAAGVSLSPALSWETSAGADSYHLQVSASDDFDDLLVNDSGITATASALSSLEKETEYFWRVRAKNAGGAGDWSGAISFTTIISAPSQPQLSAPADDAESMHLSPTLTWRKMEEAESFTVQLSTASSFATFIVNESGVTDTNYAVSSLEDGTEYFWRVRGTNEGGNSEWSAVFSFTTIVAAPGSPQLIAPANIADLIPVDASLTWHSVQNAGSYSLLLSVNENFSDPVIDSDEIEDTTLTTSALENFTKYYWKVRAVNDGGEGEWSSVRSFRTIVVLPEAVTLVTPENKDSIVISESASLVWQTGTPMVERYCIEIATDESMEDAVTDTVTDTSFAFSALTENTRYWWRVRACNVAGWGPFSGKHSFFIEEEEIAVNTPKEFKVLTFSANAQGGMFRFALPKRADVAIDLYRINGRLVCHLLNSVHDAGIHSLQFPHLTNGTYFMKFTAGEYRYNQKLIISR